MNKQTYEWDLEPLKQGKKFSEKRKDWRTATDEFVSHWKTRTDYLEKPEILKKALDDYERWKREYGTEPDEVAYFWLKTKQNQTDPTIRANYNGVDFFSKHIENDMKFFEISLARITAEKQKELLENPDLHRYKHFLERIFLESRYILSEAEEKIMNLKSGSAYYSWVTMVSGLLSKEEGEVIDEDGKKKTKNFSEITSLLNSMNKETRDSAALALNYILEKNKDIAENEINAVLGDKKINDELRGLVKPEMHRHMNDDVDSSIVDILSECVSKRFDIAHRYYELKAKLLGVKKLAYHERNVDIGSIDKKYSFEESISLISDVFSKLDKDFSDILKMFVNKNQIDVFPRAGKRGGAFCVYFGLKQPTYILLNHTDRLHDVLTFAHELGHGINNELIKKKQHALNFGTPLSTAEVASTFMEDFVLEKLLDEADDNMRLMLLMQKLNGDISTIIRQIACYRFEQELHKLFREKGYLSSHEIGLLFQKHMAAYMGDKVEQSPGSENWWIHWGHIRSFFYNYSYASGLLISKYMQKKVREDPAFISQVKEFLSAGYSDSPQNIFARMNIDIANPNFWNEGLDEIERLLTEAEKLAEKINGENIE